MFTTLPTSELAHPDPALDALTTRDLRGDMEWLNEYFKAPVCGPYAHITDVLNDEALASLATLEVPENGKCPSDILLGHPIAGPLARTMGKISLMNRYADINPDGVVYSLRNQTSDDFFLPPHRDFLDGNAVLFNYGVVGSLFYIINGRRVQLDNNEMVILNGSADWIDVTEFVVPKVTKPAGDGRTYGGASPIHAVEGVGRTIRNRLLVYADGVPTKLTQLAA